MFFKRAFLLVSLGLAGAAIGQSSPTPPAMTAEQIASASALVTANTRPMQLRDGKMSGPGAEFVIAKTARAQFVLFGEDHHDRDTPIFAGALFNRLRQAHGFQYLAVEQDPVAIDTITSPAYRGNVRQIAALVRQYPTHIGFASDQDLQLLADISAFSTGKPPSVWGLEQAQGASRYLEEIERLAPNGSVRAEAGRLLALARKEDRKHFGLFMHDEPRSLGWMQALQASFHASPGSRADYLLTNLTKSVEIYSYNRRGNEGEPVGLYNNTMREALFKQHFMERYREAARGGKLPKVMFKQGDWHMYHGKSPGQAYTIGNFAHEFAISNGMEAYGLSVFAVQDRAKGFSEWPKWMLPILPAAVPAQPVVIDLTALRPRAREFTRQVAATDQWQLRDFIHGFHALVILPVSAPASWELSGFGSPNG